MPPRLQVMGCKVQTLQLIFLQSYRTLQATTVELFAIINILNSQSPTLVITLHRIQIKTLVLVMEVGV